VIEKRQPDFGKHSAIRCINDGHYKFAGFVASFLLEPIPLCSSTNNEVVEERDD